MLDESPAVHVHGTGAVSRESTYSLTVTGSSTGTVTVTNPGARYGLLEVARTWTGKPGSYQVTVTATDSGGVSGNTPFGYTIW